MKRLLLVLILVFFNNACTNKASYLSIIVPGSQHFDARSLSQAQVTKNVYGESWRPIIFLFPIGHPKFDTAVHEALANGKGNVLTNTTIMEETRWWILFGYTKLEVHGDAVDVSRTSRPMVWR